MAQTAARMGPGAPGQTPGITVTAGIPYGDARGIQAGKGAVMVERPRISSEVRGRCCVSGRLHLAGYESSASLNSKYADYILDLGREPSLKQSGGGPLSGVRATRDDGAGPPPKMVTLGQLQRHTPAVVLFRGNCWLPPPCALDLGQSWRLPQTAAGLPNTIGHESSSKPVGKSGGKSSVSEKMLYVTVAYDERQRSSGLRVSARADRYGRWPSGTEPHSGAGGSNCFRQRSA